MLTALRFGFILSLMQFIWIIGEYLVGLHTVFIADYAVCTKFSMLPSSLILLWGLVARKAELGGQLSYLQALEQGLGVGLTVGVLSLGVHYLFFTYINPNFFADVQAHAINNLGMGSIEALKHFNFPTHLIHGALAPPVGGLLTNSVAGLLVKTRWR